MKLICKDYYKFLRDKYIIGLINYGLNNSTTHRYGSVISYNVPVSILIRLSKDENWFIRTKVAGIVNTPDYILEILKQDSDIDVKYAALLPRRYK